MRINVSSLAYSWLIALVFLALINVWAHPPVEASQPHNAEVILSTQILSADQIDLEQLKATAWCALDSDQVAVMSLAGEVRRFRGSMAIAPEWRGESLTDVVQKDRLENCAGLRLEQLDAIGYTPASERAALAFLFSDR